MTNNKVSNPFLLASLAGMLILVFFIIKPFLATLVFAIICAVSLYPIYKKILKFVGNGEALAASITLIASIICIIIPLIYLGTQLVREAIQFYESLSQMNGNQSGIVIVINDLGQKSEKFIPGTGQYFTNLSENLTLYTKQWLNWLISNLGQVISSASLLLLDLFLFFVTFYYLLKDGDKLKREIIKLIPLKDTDGESIFAKLNRAINSIIKGNLMIAFLKGILTAIGFYLFGLPNGILWGSFTIITSFIPNIGTAIVLFPAVVYLFVIGSNASAIGLAIWGIVIVGLTDNILGPKLIGKNLQLHPIFVLLSILGGLVIFGPIGLFLGPLVISLLFALLALYSEEIK